MPFAQALITAGTICCFFHTFDFIFLKLKFQRRSILFLLVLLLIATFLPVIEFTNELWISPGGFLLPWFMATLLFMKSSEKIWSIAALICIAVGLYFFSRYLILPDSVLYRQKDIVTGVLCGIASLILGKDRNTVYICALLCVPVSGMLSALEEWMLGGYAMLRLGTQDELNAMVIALILCTAGLYLRVSRKNKRQRLNAQHASATDRTARTEIPQ